MDTLASLLDHALQLPSTAIAYAVGKRLIELFPGRTVMECASCGFDFNRFVDAGLATMHPWPDAGHAQVVTAWRGWNPEMIGECCFTGKSGLSKTVTNALVQVNWKDQRIGLVQLTWVEQMRPRNASFLIADSMPQAEAFYTAVCQWSAMPHGEVLLFANGNWHKEPELFEAIKGDTFDNLVLAPGLKESLRDDVQQFFARGEIYARYRVPWKRGLLLLGPPGNGKTHAVKAMCNLLQLPVLVVQSFESRGMFSMGGESQVAEVFQTARRTAPCLLILEDLDSLVTEANRAPVLNQLDGFAANKGVCVIATTNHPERLDPAIIDRPSRFDRKYHFNLPGLMERKAYLEAWDLDQPKEVQLSSPAIEKLANATEGFSFAYLKELCLYGRMQWFNNSNGESIDTAMIAQAGILSAQMRSNIELSGAALRP